MQLKTIRDEVSFSEPKQPDRFADLPNNFKASEVCDKNVDKCLADTERNV